MSKLLTLLLLMTINRVVFGQSGMDRLESERSFDLAQAYRAEAKKTQRDNGPIRAEQMDRFIVAVQELVVELRILNARYVRAPEPQFKQEKTRPIVDGWVWVPSQGPRPRTMPPKRVDGREFDGGPDFGNGSWAQRDEDGIWRRNGG